MQKFEILSEKMKCERFNAKERTVEGRMRKNYPQPWIPGEKWNQISCFASIFLLYYLILCVSKNFDLNFDEFIMK